MTKAEKRIEFVEEIIREYSSPDSDISPLLDRIYKMLPDVIKQDRIVANMAKLFTDYIKNNKHGMSKSLANIFGHMTHVIPLAAQDKKRSRKSLALAMIHMIVSELPTISPAYLNASICFAQFTHSEYNNYRLKTIVLPPYQQYTIECAWKMGLRYISPRPLTVEKDEPIDVKIFPAKGLRHTPASYLYLDAWRQFPNNRELRDKVLHSINISPFNQLSPQAAKAIVGIATAESSGEIFGFDTPLTHTDIGGEITIVLNPNPRVAGFAIVKQILESSFTGFDNYLDASVSFSKETMSACVKLEPLVRPLSHEDIEDLQSLSDSELIETLSVADTFDTGHVLPT